MSLQLPGASAGTRKPYARWVTRLKPFRGSLLFVALPTLIASVYFFLIAADQYASEARFVIRSPSQVQVTGLTGLLQNAGIARSSDDVYAVQDFILSRDALSALVSTVDLRQVFGRPEADYPARYPNLIYGETNEDFFRYYRKMVDVIYDATTNICTLVVKAFRPDDAQRVAALLLERAEQLVNQLNARARKNAVADADAELRAAESRSQKAQIALLAYRKRESLIDPGKTSGAMFENVAKMEADLTVTNTRLEELTSGSKGSPLRDALATHAAALRKQIAAAKSGMAGNDASMAPKIAEYEQLLLRKELAAKELGAAIDSLQAAHAEARRQQIYLDRVVEPGLPDKALYPTRVVSVLIVLISSFLLYSIGKLLIAGVREHGQD